MKDVQFFKLTYVHMQRAKKDVTHTFTCIVHVHISTQKLVEALTFVYVKFKYNDAGDDIKHIATVSPFEWLFGCSYSMTM